VDLTVSEPSPLAGLPFPLIALKSRLRREDFDGREPYILPEPFARAWGWGWYAVAMAAMFLAGALWRDC
jgi:hypothetical protein